MNLCSMRPIFVLVLFLTLMTIPAHLFSEEVRPASPKLTENDAKEIIERVYLEVLQRYPDERGLYTYSIFLLEQGKSEEWLREVLLNSEEGLKIRHKKQQRTYILYAVAAFPLLFIGIAFYFRKSTKDFIFNSLLVLFSVGFACLFLEIGLRMAAAYQDHKNARAWSELDTAHIPPKNAAVFLRDIIRLSANPSLIYEILPNLSVRFMGGGVTTDNKGFRVTPGSCEQTGAYTILGLGDSMMFGWGVHDNETYLSYFAEAMAEDCIRIVNMAVPGYNTVMEVEALKEKGVQLHPDLVVMHFVDNDLYLPNFIRKEDKHITLTHSYLLAALSRWQGTRIRTRPFDHLVRSPWEVPDEYQYMVGVDAYRLAMREFKELSRVHNFKILLLSNWTAPDFVEEIVEELAIPLVELGEPLQRYCRENGLPEFQGSVLTVSKDDPHYSPVAHRIVANELSDHLLQDPSLAQKFKPATVAKP